MLLHPNMVYKWKKEFLEKNHSLFEEHCKEKKELSRNETTLEKKNNQMLKTIRQLMVESEYLQDCFHTIGLLILEDDPEKK